MFNRLLHMADAALRALQTAASGFASTQIVLLLTGGISIGWGAGKNLVVAIGIWVTAHVLRFWINSHKG